jgi:hypothetical protein
MESAVFSFNEEQCMHISTKFEIQSTGSGQISGNTKKLRNRNCFCWLH